MRLNAKAQRFISQLKALRVYRYRGHKITICSNNAPQWRYEAIIEFGGKKRYDETSYRHPRGALVHAKIHIDLSLKWGRTSQTQLWTM